MTDLDERLRSAIRHFWKQRSRQARQQGLASGVKDAGSRAAVTGGRHLDGFVDLCRQLLLEAGIRESNIFWRKQLELPGYFRPEKKWDLVVVAEGRLMAVVEFKAQVGPSFGNNFNNRTEESIGNATDIWAAYREGAFKPSARPWLGFVFLLEDCPQSTKAVGVAEPHFGVFPEFAGASYAKRYEILLLKLLRERLYDGASLILSARRGGAKGNYSCPVEELSFQNFAASLFGHALAHVKKSDHRQGR